MNCVEWILTGYAGIFCFLWCVFYLKALRDLVTVPILEQQEAPFPQDWPRLSVVVPACNEAKTLEAAALTLAEQDYPDLELVLVDDRSTDGTGAIMDAVAARHRHAQAVHVSELPEGWLGKVHALHLGTQRASGEWILYADADVHFGAGALRKAVALCMHREIHHLALMPRLRTSSFRMEVLIRAFALLFLQATRAADAVRKSSSGPAVGVGAFNLVHRPALEKIGGLEGIRMEVADDVGLGTLLRNSGASQYFAFGFNDLAVEIYGSLRAAFEGFEKNFFGAAARYSVLRMLMICVGIWALAFAPLVAVLPWAAPALRAAGIVCCGLTVATALVWQLRFKQCMLASCLAPVGQLILSLILLRSGFACLRQGGINWRGTTYPVGELKAGTCWR
jgi:hypothetical protein